jgi:hypothetical protein
MVRFNSLLWPQLILKTFHKFDYYNILILKVCVSFIKIDFNEIDATLGGLLDQRLQPIIKYQEEFRDELKKTLNVLVNDVETIKKLSL